MAKDNLEHQVDQIAGAITPEQRQAFLDAALSSRFSALDDAFRTPRPEVRDIPADVRGFRIRLDLVGAKPPVWRRLEVPGDLTLDRLHLVIQAAMGWFDRHLHRFRTGRGHGSAYFITPFDVEEGEDGVREDEVRLDQVVTAKGDRLWYDYDFGDDWEHVLAVEAVSDDLPDQVRCIAGRMACPPEDCGGIWGYHELARWVRGGHDPAAVPAPFEDAQDARAWLPLDWHPDAFDLAEFDAAVSAVMAEPVQVTGALANLLTQLEQSGDRALTQLLAREPWHTEAELTEERAAALVDPFVTLLAVIGDGVRLTGAGRLPPALVAELAERTGVSSWWIGKANREDQTWPVALLRESARALGLVRMRHGQLLPTAAARRSLGEPLALWHHIVARLPIGKADIDQDAGWLALAVVGSEVPAEDWRETIGALLFGLGWQVQGDPFASVPASSPTLDVLELLAGRTRIGRITGANAAVAATARVVAAAQAPPPRR